MRNIILGALAAFWLAIVSPATYAQRGAGDHEGIARQAEKPAIVSLSGKLTEIRTLACEATTGRSPAGTHILLETPEGRTLNIHLGPASAVAEKVAELPLGDQVTVQAFRTDKLKENEYIARSIETGKGQITLRDEQLRPLWAAGRPAAAAPAGGSGGPVGGMRRRVGPPWQRGGAGPGCPCGMCPGRAGRNTASTAEVQPGTMGMTAIEHGNVFALLNHHQEILRSVEEIPSGVRTTTTTTNPDLVETLRTHVKQMSQHVRLGQPVRMWDPVFRDLFAHSDEITLAVTEIDGGIAVTETSNNPDVLPLIRAHAKKVDAFVAGGHMAARPPWAGGGRGNMMRGR